MWALVRKYRIINQIERDLFWNTIHSYTYIYINYNTVCIDHISYMNWRVRGPNASSRHHSRMECRQKYLALCFCCSQEVSAGQQQAGFLCSKLRPKTLTIKTVGQGWHHISCSIKAWRKSNFSPFYETMTYRPTKRRTWGVIGKLHFK